MKALVVGAGATIEESRRSGVNFEFQFPLVSNFAKVMWKEYLPHPFLHPFLASMGVLVDPTGDKSLQDFLDLEKAGKTNVEEFFEFCWQIRDAFPEYPNAWHNMQHHGFLRPITDAMFSQFYESGVGWRPLTAGMFVSKILQSGDLIINLNYDTVFEMAITASGKPISYLPSFNPTRVHVAKPHGSVNLLVKPEGCCFGQPAIHGTIVPTMDDSLAASILPPRLHKHYSQHPISQIIMDATLRFAPQELLFWGVGFTQSDLDLNALYSRLAMTSDFITVINPEIRAAHAASDITKRAVLHFPTLDSWLVSRGILTKAE